MRTVEELYSILRKVNETVTYSQNDDVICASLFSALWQMFLELHPGSSMRIVAFNGSEGEHRDYNDLSSAAKKTIIVLNDGLKQSFFNRYHPINSLKHSMSAGLRRKATDALDYKYCHVFEFIWILIPKFRQGATLLQLIEKLAETIPDRKILELSYEIGASVAEMRKQLVQTDFENVKNLIWKRVRKLATQHFTLQPEKENNQPTSVSSTHFPLVSDYSTTRQTFDPDLL